LAILIRRPLLHLSILGESIYEARFPIFISKLSQIYLRYSLHRLLEQFSFAIRLSVWRQLIRRESQPSHKIEFRQSLDTMPYACWSVAKSQRSRGFATHCQETMHVKIIFLRSNYLLNLFLATLKYQLIWTFIGSPIQYFVKSVNLNITLLVNMKRSTKTSPISSKVSIYLIGVLKSGMVHQVTPHGIIRSCIQLCQMRWFVSSYVFMMMIFVYSTTE
jgi:hypothetical protein